MIKEIVISYCELNEKYDLIVNGELWGKHYSVEEAVNGLHKRINHLVVRYKNDK